MRAEQTNSNNGYWLEDSNPATIRSRTTRLLALLLCLIIPIASPSLVRAQDDAEEEVELVIDADFELDESNFDQWIFGAQTSDHGLKRVESLLTLNVRAIDHVCGLTEEQVAKLELAGQGDIKRFYDDIAVAHAKFMRVRRNRKAINEFYQELPPLQARFNAGLFNETSFFRKVLNRSLDDEQSAKYEEDEWERRRFRYDAKLVLVVQMMERTIPLRAEQRERFIQLLKEETQPPKSFGAYDYYFVLYKLSKLPDQQLEPIFDEAQWKAIQQFMAQGRALEMFLKQQKVLP